jgi:hypothetical protein
MQPIQTTFKQNFKFEYQTKISCSKITVQNKKEEISAADISTQYFTNVWF